MLNPVGYGLARVRTSSPALQADPKDLHFAMISPEATLAVIRRRGRVSPMHTSDSPPSQPFSESGNQSILATADTLSSGRRGHRINTYHINIFDH